MRRRRNRKRTGPIWRRLPEVRGVWPRVKAGFVSALPVMIATIGLAAVAAGGFAGYRFITESPRFAVKVIEVRGNEALTTDRVLALLGVVAGDNIFSVELAALGKGLERNPMIASAVVRRRLPDTLIVEVQEHQAGALVALDGLYLADASGHVFKRAAVERGEGAGLPVITGLSRADYVQDSEAVQAGIREALSFVELYRLGDRPALGEVHLDPRHGISFATYEHAVTVRLGRGDPGTLDRRLRAFDVAWQALTSREREQTRIVYADASTRPDRITVGFQTSEQ